MLIREYDSVRVENAKSDEDIVEHCERDREAFVAGVQYALDAMLQDSNFIHYVSGRRAMSMNQAAYLAVNVLNRAKAGHPQ